MAHDEEVNNLRKSGHLEEALQIAEQDFAQEQNQRTLSALILCLNDQSKNLRGEQRMQIVWRMILLVQHTEERNDVMTTCVGWAIYRILHEEEGLDIQTRKRLLLCYLQIQPPSPSLLHSRILNEAVNIEKTYTPQFLFSAFVNRWKLTTLREEDWQGGKTKQGQHYSSLVEKVITAYVKEMMVTPTVQPSDDFLVVIDRAVETWPANTNILRNRAQIHIKQGERELALLKYKQLLLLEPEKFYLWSELSTLVDDQDLQQALLCKALNTRTSEEYLGKIRMRLAALLIDRGQYSWAKGELQKVEQTYKQQGWTLRETYTALIQRIPAGTQEVNLRTQYTPYIQQAEAYIFSAIPSIIMVKIKEQANYKEDIRGRLNRKVTWILIDQQGNRVKIQPQRFHLPTNMTNGSCYDVGLSQGQVAHITALDALPAVPWIKKIHGQIRIKVNAQGKSFGFVGQCYVHNDLLKTISEGAEVEGVGILIQERWQCVQLTQIEQH